LAPQPEQQARGNIDVLLKAAGWHVCDADAANFQAARGVANRDKLFTGIVTRPRLHRLLIQP